MGCETILADKQLYFMLYFDIEEYEVDIVEFLKDDYIKDIEFYYDFFNLKPLHTYKKEQFLSGKKFQDKQELEDFIIKCINSEKVDTFIKNELIALINKYFRDCVYNFTYWKAEGYLDTL